MRPQVGTVDQVLARVAERQHGAVARRQLIGAGIPADAIKRRLRSGALLPEFRGVYRVGHRAPSRESLYMAAVLACGDGALLSGLAGGHLIGLLRGNAPEPEVIAPTKRCVPGITTRRARRGDHRDAASWLGIPVTSVARTLVDLAAILSTDDLARACHEAGIRHRTTPAHVESVLAHRPTSPGAASLRRVLHGDVHVTLSHIERRFLVLLRENGLPAPRTNRLAGGRHVDCRWVTHRLTIELDGYHFHRSRHSWELDRRREREARARGDEFRRYTYGDVIEDPSLVLTELRALLPAQVSRPGGVQRPQGGTLRSTT